MKFLFIALAFLMIGCLNNMVEPPGPVFPIPTQRQLDWQELEFYAFVHFGINTFTDKEWGLGDEDLNEFNPSTLDCRQWARVCKEAGMKGIILTAKHHDGFCLWPSQYTDHSVKNTRWKNGAGDVLQELSDACKEYGLKMGIYLSPWDRNHADYGQREYITYFRNQLRELLTNYGDIFEVWFDGANGGTGYYGGANEERRVDKHTYYDWETTHKLVRELQQSAVMFSDAGPDVRWVGNEQGHAYSTTWSNLMRDSVYPGMIEYADEYASGQENGSHWVPAETNVSIRPGWFYHQDQDEAVKPLQKLIDMYYASIGQNTSWLLNLPVDKRGLVHENDVRRLRELQVILAREMDSDLCHNARVSASNERGRSFGVENVNDGMNSTYWATDDGITAASIVIEFNEPLTFNRFLVQEYIALGQRIKAFSIEIEVDGDWQEIVQGSTVGYKRILRLPNSTTSRIRFNVLDAKASPTISNIEIYQAP